MYTLTLKNSKLKTYFSFQMLAQQQSSGNSQPVKKTTYKPKKTSLSSKTQTLVITSYISKLAP